MEERTGKTAGSIRRHEVWEREVIAHLLDHAFQERDILLDLPLDWFSEGPPREAVYHIQGLASFGQWIGRSHFQDSRFEPEDHPMVTFVRSLPPSNPEWTLRQKLGAMRMSPELERVRELAGHLLEAPIPDVVGVNAISEELEAVANRLRGLSQGSSFEAGPRSDVQSDLWKFCEWIQGLDKENSDTWLLPGFSESSAQVGPSGLVLVEGSGQGTGEVDRYALSLLSYAAKEKDFQALIYHREDPFGHRDIYSELLGMAPVSLVGWKGGSNRYWKAIGAGIAALNRRGVSTRSRPSLDQTLLDSLQEDIGEARSRVVLLLGFGWREFTYGSRIRQILQGLRRMTRDRSVVIVFALDQHEPGLLNPRPGHPDPEPPSENRKQCRQGWWDVRSMVAESADFVVRVRPSRKEAQRRNSRKALIALRKGPAGPLPPRPAPWSR